MRRSRLSRGLAAVLLSGLLAGCELLSGPDGTGAVAEEELTFVRVAPDSPPLNALEVSFWAVRGQTREVQLRYDATGYAANGKCLLFRVPARSIPAGSAPGDSVRITVRVVDPSVFRFEFEPAGLVFDPAHPAELEVRYRWADPDYNRDGVVDSRDRQLAERFGFWRQERPGEPWHRVATVRRENLLEVHARVSGFTQYALATDFAGPRAAD